jgi:hypothetical protein
MIRSWRQIVFEFGWCTFLFAHDSGVIFLQANLPALIGGLEG